FPEDGRCAAAHRLCDKGTAIGARARKRREEIAGLHLAAVARKTCKRHAPFFRPKVRDASRDGRPGMWFHYVLSFATGANVAGMPSIGAIRAMTRPASGAAVKPARAKPNVSFVPCGSSSITNTR